MSYIWFASPSPPTNEQQAAMARLHEAYVAADRTNRAEASDECGGGNIPKDFYDLPHQYDDDTELVVRWALRLE